MNERDRIEFIMRCYNLTPSQLADRTGMQRASVSHILSGRNKASLDVILKLHDAFPDVELEWLMTGRGTPPTVTGEQASASERAENTPLPDAQLFSAYSSEGEAVILEKQQPVARRQAVVVQPKQPAEKNVRRPVASSRSLAAVATAGKQVREVRIFYTDGTYETLIPEKR